MDLVSTRSVPIHILRLILCYVRFRLVLYETRGTRHVHAILFYAFASLRSTAILRARTHNNIVISSISTIVDVRLVRYTNRYH